MNHLAHFFLSCENDDLLIGNFIADFIRNKEVTTFSEAVQEGIFLHRKIDTFTDNHKIVRQGTQRLRQYHGKYAPVILDVLYDNILIKNWHLYSGQNLKDFTQSVYIILQERFDELPLKLQKRIPNMIASDWLYQYGTDLGLRFVFQKMDERTKFPSNFVAAVEHFNEDYKLYEKEFNLFFPDLMEFVEKECAC